MPKPPQVIACDWSGQDAVHFDMERGIVAKRCVLARNTGLKIAREDTCLLRERSLRHELNLDGDTKAGTHNISRRTLLRTSRVTRLSKNLRDFTLPRLLNYEILKVEKYQLSL